MGGMPMGGMGMGMQMGGMGMGGMQMGGDGYAHGRYGLCTAAVDAPGCSAAAAVGPYLSLLAHVCYGPMSVLSMSPPALPTPPLASASVSRTFP